MKNPWLNFRVDSFKLIDTNQHYDIVNTLLGYQIKIPFFWDISNVSLSISDAGNNLTCANAYIATAITLGIAYWQSLLANVPQRMINGIKIYFTTCRNIYNIRPLWSWQSCFIKWFLSKIIRGKSVLNTKHIIIKFSVMVDMATAGCKCSYF